MVTGNKIYQINAARLIRACEPCIKAGSSGHISRGEYGHEPQDTRTVHRFGNRAAAFQQLSFCPNRRSRRGFCDHPRGRTRRRDATVVTGLRQSLTSTRNIKRNAPQVVDSVVAEDIGKFPDIAVSDTVARIPGVQVIRQGGEASRVPIRGLPAFATTYNSREIFTAETPVVALQEFPSANYAEGRYQGFRNNIGDRLLEVPQYGGTSSNLVDRSGSNLLRSGTVTNPGGNLFTFQGATSIKTDTYQGAVGANYESGPLKLTVDVAHTDTTFKGST